MSGGSCYTRTMDEPSRRGFLAKLGALATAPVVTAFVSDDATGLAVPDHRLAVEPAPIVISSLMAPGPGFLPGDVLRAPAAQLVLWVDGRPWRIAAHRL